MSSPFLSSEEYDERAHALYTEGQFDEALALLREGLSLYPGAVELHVGVGYARLARDEFAWARRSFDEALVFDPEHEDALAGLGEVLLKFGQATEAIKAFETTVALGYDDDIDLMLQIGRALFREGYVEDALEFFQRGALRGPDSAEAAACVGYAQHRLALDAEAIASLLRALTLDKDFSEARVYLANMLYDAGDLDRALTEFEHTTPDDHWDELGIWRLIELKKSVHRLTGEQDEFKAWDDRLVELAGTPNAIDELLDEIEQRFMEQETEALEQTHGQLETLGGLLSGLAVQQSEQQPEYSPSEVIAADGSHRVIMRDGSAIDGTWEEIVQALRDARDASRTLDEFMALEARRHYGATGMRIASHAPEAFIRESANAGLLQILK